MKAYLLVLHFLIIANGRSIFVPCPELTSSGFLYALTPDCQLITAPSSKADQFQQISKDAFPTGPCEISPSTGLQHPIIMVSTLKFLEENELPNLHILYHSPNEVARRIVRIPSSTWSSTEVTKTLLDSIETSVNFPDTMTKIYDTCSLLNDDVMRCYFLGSENATEVVLIGRNFPIDEKDLTINPEKHKVFLPATSLATHVPVLALTKENGDVDLLVSHVMKWLWRVSDKEEHPHTFSVVIVPTKVTPASLSHFALPLVASPMGISSVVCDRKSMDPPDCAHHFTDLSSYSQCLMRTSFKMLVGFIPSKGRDKQLPLRRGLKGRTSEEIIVPNMATTTQDANEMTIIGPESPLAIKTDVKVVQSPPSNSFAIVLIAVIFAVMLILILIFLLCLLCYFQRRFRQRDVNEAVMEKMHKEIEHGIPVQNAATKSDVERLMQAVDEAKKISEKAAEFLQQLPSPTTGLNEWIFPKTKSEQVKLQKPPTHKDSFKKLKFDDKNDVIIEKVNPGKIKVRVTLKEDPDSALRTVEQSTTPDDTGSTPQTTWISTVPQSSEPISSAYNNSSSEFQTEYLPQPNVRQLDHMCVQKPSTEKMRGKVGVNGKTKKFLLRSSK